MERAIIIGQSHTGAIAQALAAERSSVSGISVHRLGAEGEQDVITLRDAMSLVSDLDGQVRIFLSMLGTFHNILGLLRSGEDFDFLIDCDDAPDPAASARIPYRAVESAFAQHLTESVKILKLQAAAKSPLFLLSTPPPKQDNGFILERFLRQKKQSYRGKGIAEYGVERPESRLKLWSLEARLTAAWAAGEGMHFVAPPGEALSSDGFLDVNFYADDATHANARYGALVVDQIMAVIEGIGSAAANG
jgi:hypothetical protein